MRRNKSCFLPFCYLLLVFLSACAQIGPLTGGAKDVTPPKLVLVSPKDTSLNVPVKGTKITFRFDELVDVKSVQQNLVINPITENSPSVAGSKNTMTVTFDEKLLPNTTYQLQFGNSIGDIHEGNKYKNLTYIFSTGATIDTNTLSGKVTWALTAKPALEISILLFENLSDTAVTRTKPSYIVKTDTAGKYSLSAIKQGVYQVFAIGDKNKNSTYDLGESLGFMDTTLTIHGKDTVNFIMSAPKVERNFVKKKIQAFFGYHKFVLSDTLPDAYIINADANVGSDKIHYETKNDTLEVYYKDLYSTELKFFLKRNQLIFDTISLDLPNQTKIDSLIHKYGKKFGMTINKNLLGVMHDDLYLSFSYPIKLINPDKCVLMMDSVKEKLILTNENKNEEGNLITTYLPMYKRRVLNNLKSGKDYHIMILPDALTNYWDVSNKDTLRTAFKTFSADEIGTIKVKLVIPDSIHHYVLQLLDINGKPLQECAALAKKDNIITFYNLIASDYRLRLINDRDVNKKFSPANYSKHKQPEEVYFYEKLIKVPAGWDVETEWDFKKTKVK